MLSIYFSITHTQFRSSRLCLLWSALGPIKIWKLFIYFVWAWHSEGVVCGVWYTTVATHRAELNKQTADSIITFYFSMPARTVRQSDQHCNFRKNTDRSSISASEQPQRNTRHSSPYQNQVSRSGQENLEKFKFANWRKILWRKKCWPLQRDKTTFYFVLLKNFSPR